MINDDSSSLQGNNAQIAEVPISKTREFLQDEELFTGVGKPRYSSYSPSVRKKVLGIVMKKNFLQDFTNPKDDDLQLLTDSFSGLDVKEVYHCLLEITKHFSHFYNLVDSEMNKTGSTDIQDTLNLIKLYPESSLQLFRQNAVSVDSSLSSESDVFECCQDTDSRKNEALAVNEIGELHYQNKRLASDISMLKNQLTLVDEAYQQQLRESDKLKKKISSLESNVERSKDIEVEKQGIQDALEALEWDHENLKNQKADLELHNIKLRDDLQILEERLNAAHSEIDQGKQTTLEIMLSFLDEKKQTQDLSLSNHSLEQELKEKSAQIHELELTLKELKDANHDLQAANELKDDDLMRTNYFVQMLENDKDTDMESSCDSQSKSWLELGDITIKDDSRPNTLNSFVNQDFLKHSLCQEMFHAVEPSEDLPSPVCGKELSSVDNDRSGNRIYLWEPACKKIKIVKKNVLRHSKVNTKTKSNGKLQSKLQRARSVIHVSYRAKLRSSDSSRMVKNIRTKIIKQYMDWKRRLQKKNSHFLFEIRDEIQKHRIFLEKENMEAAKCLRSDLKLTHMEELLLSDQADAPCLKLDTQGSGDSHALSSTPIWAVADSNFTTSHKTISDFPANDIHKQVKAEINALKTQLVRSHALLSYLQMKEKLSEMCIPEMLPQVDFSNDAQQGKVVLLQQKSFDGQSIVHHFHQNTSNRDGSSTGSHGSTPLHRSMHAHSCPALVGESLSVSKSVFTDSKDPMHDISGSSNNDEVFLKQDVQNRFVSVHTETRQPTRLSDCSSSSVRSNTESTECGTCEVHLTQNSTTSLQFGRQRTNSFLSAVQVGPKGGGDSSGSIVPKTEPSASKTSEVPFSNKLVKISDQTTTEKEVRKDQHVISSGGEGKSNDDPGAGWKPSQRSMRRGSGTGSPNSLTSIPRYPAFDFSEQDEEHLIVSSPTLEGDSKVKQKTSDGRSAPHHDTSQSTPYIDSTPPKKQIKSLMLMPEAMENSETESAKGSFEYEPVEAPAVSDGSTSLDTVCPSLPQALLSRLGLSKDNESQIIETFDAQELEDKFLTLALAFKTDRTTLSKRLEIQNRQRDMAEKDVESEIKAMKSSLNYLNLNATESEIRDLISTIQNHIDIISVATSKVSARSETFGAVKQEEKVSLAFEVILLYVENLKRALDKEHKELEEAKQMLVPGASSKSPIHNESGRRRPEEARKSMKSVSLAIGTIKSDMKRHSRAFTPSTYNSGHTPPTSSIGHSFTNLCNGSSSSSPPLTESEQNLRNGRRSSPCASTPALTSPADREVFLSRTKNGVLNGGQCTEGQNTMLDSISENEEEEYRFIRNLIWLFQSICSLRTIQCFFTFVFGFLALVMFLATLFLPQSSFQRGNQDLVDTLYDFLKSFCRPHMNV